MAIKEWGEFYRDPGKYLGSSRGYEKIVRK